MASKKYTFKFDVDSQGFEQSLNNIANKIRDIFSNISIPTDSLDKAVKNVETSLNSVLKNYSTAMSKQDFSAISGSLSNASAEMKNLLSTINSSSFSGKNSAVNSVNEIINSLTKAQQAVGKFDDMAGSVGNSINNMIPANAAERISELNKQLEKLSATQKLVQNLRVDEGDIFAQGSTAEGFDSIIAKAKEYKTVLKDFNSSTKNIDFSKAMQVDPTSIENLAKAKNSGEQLSILIEKLEGNPLDLSKILGKNFDTKSFEATFDNLGDYIDRNMTEIESSVAKMVTSTQSELDSLKQSANSTTSLMFNSSGSSDIEQTNSKSNYSKSGRKITLTLDHKKLDADFDAELKSLGEKAAANPIPVTLKLQTTADSINVGELAEKVNKKKKNTPVENTVELQVNLDSKKAESKLATAIGNLQKIADKKIVKIPVSIDYDSGNLKIDNAKVEESIKKANDISNLKNEYGVGKKNNSKASIKKANVISNLQNEYGVGKKNNSKVQVESEVDVDPAKIQTNAAALVAAYNDALAKMPVKVTVDDSSALKNINALVSKYESKTGSLGKYNYDFSVVVNETGATQTIANLDSLLKVYDNQEINLNVDVTGISETFKKVNSLYETLKVLVRNPIIIKTEASVPAATSAQKVALTAGTIKAKDIKVTGKVGIPVEPKINIRSFVASINKLLSGSTVKINTEPVVKNNTASAQIANSSTIKTELSKTDVASVKSDYTKLLTGLRNRAPVKVKIKLGEKTETPDIADITKLSEASQISLQKHQALMESISTKEIELIGNIIAKASELNEAIRLGVKDLSSSLSTLNKLGVDITSKGSISNAKANIAKAKKTTTTAATIDTQPETSQENLDIATLTAQYNTYNTGLEKSYKLENQILSLRSQKGNNKDQIAVLTQRKEAIDENIAKLREEIDGNTADSNSIKGLKAQREAIIKTMQEQHRAEVELGNAKISDSQTKDTSSTIDSKYEKYIVAQANATSKLNAISKTLSSETSSQITQATGLIEKYIKTQEDAGVSMESTIKDCRDGKVSLEDLTKAYADFNATTKTTYEQAKKLTTSQYSTIIRGLGSAVKDSNGNTLNFSGESNALNQVKQETSGMKNVTISDWRTTVNGMKEVIVTASDLNGGITKIKYTFNELNGAMYKTSAASDTTITAFDRMTVSAKKVVSYFIHYAAMFLSAQTFYQAIRQGVTYVESLDTALTSLQVVTGKSDEELSQFATDAQRIATSVASTTTEVANSATDWARLGYSMSDSLELAAQSAKLAKTGFMEVSEATEYMTSSIQAFYGADIQNGLTSVADAALHINDELVQIGNTQPITSEGLGEALEKSAASLVAAGNSVEQSVALVASSNSVLQNPSSVGNALKTVSMRLRGTDSDQIAEETGEEIEGMNTSASKLYETIRKLTSVKSNDYQGISILTSTGSFRSTFDILKDISQVWSEMNDVSKAGLLEDVAGKRQSAAVAAIFNNPNSLTSAYESANSATGASDTAMTIALDSVEAKVSKLQNSWQAFWQTLIDSDSAKKILDIVNAIVTGLDKIIAGGNSIGNLSSLVAILTGGSQIIKTIMSDQPSQYSGGLFNFLKSKVSSVTASNTKIANKDYSSQQVEAIKNVINASQNSIKVQDDFKKVLIKVGMAETEASECGTDLASAYRQGSLSAASIKKSTETATTAISGLGSAAATIGKTLVASLKSAAVAMAISFAVNLAITGISKIVNAVKDAKEDISSFEKSISDIQTTNADNSETISKLSDDYYTLAKGVDEAGNNVSLTSDQYKKYKDIVNQLVDLYPSLNEGHYDENSLLSSKNDLISESIKLQKEEYKQSLKEQVSPSNVKKMEKDYSTAYNDVYENTDATASLRSAIINGYEKSGTNNTSGTTVEEYLNNLLGDMSPEDMGSNFGVTDYWTNETAQKIADQYGTIIESFSDNLKNSLDSGDITQREYDNTIQGIKDASEEMTSYTAKIDDANHAINQMYDIVLMLTDGYDGLDSASQALAKSFADTFTVDDDRNLGFNEISSQIDDFVGALDNPEYQNVLSGITSIDKSTISSSDYDKKVQDFESQIEQLFKDVGLNMPKDLSIPLVFNLYPTDSDGQVLTPETMTDAITGIVSDIDSETISKMSSKDRESLYNSAMDWQSENPGQKTDYASLKSMLDQQQKIANTNDIVRKSYDDVSAAVVTYQSGISTLSKLSTNYQTVTADEYDQLSSLIDVGTDLDGIVKTYTDDSGNVTSATIENIAAFKNLVAASKKTSSAMTEVDRNLGDARSSYAKLLKQLKDVTTGNNKYTDSALNSASSILDQINNTQNLIEQYDRLKLELLGVTQAFTDFTNAETLDAQNTNDASFVTSLQEIVDVISTGNGYGTNKFKAALEVIPDGVITDINDYKKSIEEIYNWIIKLNKAGLITFSEDNTVDALNSKNASAFDNQLTSTDINGRKRGEKSFDESKALYLKTSEGYTTNTDLLKTFNSETDAIDAFAKALNMSSAELAGFISIDEKSNWQGLSVWGDILTDQDSKLQETLDGYNDLLQTQDVLNRAKARGETVDQKQQDNITNGIAQKQSELDAYGKQIVDEINQSEEIDAAIQSAQEELAKYSDEGTAGAYKKSSNDYNILLGQIGDLQKEKDKFSTPTELDVTIATQYFDDAMDEIQKQIDNLNSGGNNSVDLNVVTKYLGEDGKKLSSDDMVSGLTEAKSNLQKESSRIAGNYSDQSNTVIEAFDTINGYTFDTKQIEMQINSDDITTKINNIRKALAALTDSPYTVTINSSNLAKTVAQSKTQSTEGESKANGGLTSGEHNAVVGELGQELVVDRNTGRYYTVGNNGTEMVNLPQNAIVYNTAQTKQLLSTHKTTRGAALVEGNAHGGDGTTVHFSGNNRTNVTTTKPFSGSSSSSSKSSSSSSSDWLEAFQKAYKKLQKLRDNDEIDADEYYKQLTALYEEYYDKYGKKSEENKEKLHDEWVSLYEADQSDLDSKYSDGDISLRQYLDQYKKLYQTFYGNIEGYAKELKDVQLKYAKQCKSAYESLFSAAQTLISNQISDIQDQQSAASDALNAQKDATDDMYDSQIKSLNAQIDAYNKVIDGINDEIDAYQDEINAIDKANEQRQTAIDLQKAQYELNRAENQRTQYTYTSDKGFVYRTNPQDVKDARDDLKDKQDEARKQALQDEIDKLQDVIDGYDKKIDSLNDQIDTINDLKDASDEYYDDLVKQSDAYFDGLLNNLEEAQKKWEKLADMQDMANAMSVLESFGLSLGDVLASSDATMNGVKEGYAGVLAYILQDNQTMLDSFGTLLNIDMSSVPASIDNVTKAMQLMAVGATQSSGTVQNQLGGVSNSLTALGNQTGATDAVTSTMQSLANTNVDGLTGSLSSLATTSSSIANLGVELQNMLVAIQSISDPTEYNNAITQFANFVTQYQTLATAFKTNMTTLFGNSQTAGNGTQNGAASGMTGGWFDGFVAQVNDMSDQTEVALTKLIDEWTQFQELMVGVVGTDGSGQDENSQGSGSSTGGVSDTSIIGTIIVGAQQMAEALMSWIEVMNNWAYGDVSMQSISIGVIQLITDMATQVVAQCNTATAAIQALITTLTTASEAGISIGVSANGPASFTGNTHVGGTALADGTGSWGLNHDENGALVGELGPELRVSKNGKYSLMGKTGAELQNLKAGDIVFNHKQTEQLFKYGKINSRGRAFASGTGIDGLVKTGMPDIYSKLQKHIEAISNNIATMTPKVVSMAPAYATSGSSGSKSPTYIIENVNATLPNIKTGDDAQDLINDLGQIAQKAIQRFNK